MTVDVPEGLRYTESHEWLRVEGAEAVIGISGYAASELGDIVYVELPAIGRRVQRAAPFGVVESVKAASDLYSPASGEVIAVNTALTREPELVNTDPYGEGWMVRLHLDEPDEAGALMDAAAYRAQLAEG